MEGQAGAEFIQLSIQLVLIDHMLHVCFWSLGDTIVNEIGKKKKTYPDEENRGGKTKTKQTSKQKLYVIWGC